MGHIQVLHMNRGKGETSYANNSTVQRKIISLENPIIWEAISGLIMWKNHDEIFPECLGIADLGCSSGPNTLALISEVIDGVYESCRKIGKDMPELRVCLNDLPGNDFNNIFMSLPGFYGNLQKETIGFGNRCFISGVPGSFYGRLFPTKSMHFIHSSSSLHWLSQVPPSLDSNVEIPLNKGKLYISKSSPISVRNAYHSQFHKDFSLFLKSRSEEMVSGGRMVLSFMGRSSSDPYTEDSCYQWELLAQALTSMIPTQGDDRDVLEEKIDSFNAPYYAPSMDEVKTEVEEEGSFEINCLKGFEINWDEGCQNNESESGDDDAQKLGQEMMKKLSSRGHKVAKTIRAVVESMLESHFGDGIDMEALFVKYAELVDDYFSKARPIYINFIMSFTRK